jgi:probable phosphoglycerate mutase
MQAKMAGGYLKNNFLVYHIYSSPLKRARQTAEIIADVLGKEVTYSKSIIETDLDGWQGKTADSDYNSLVRKYYKAPKGATGFKESTEDVAKRMSNFILKIARKHHGKDVVAVSHAHPIFSAKHFFVKDGYGEIRTDLVPNCSITVLEFKEDKLVSHKLILPAPALREKI